jgi:serine/threonine protein phosphatase PrpC
MLNSNPKIKEYYNLNGYYLRLFLTTQQLSLISYNSNLLDGIKYELNIKLEDIQKNATIRQLTVAGLYELIIKKINEKRIMINGDQNSVILTLLETGLSGTGNNIQLSMFRNRSFYANEYENVLANVISNLRQENNIMKNEINEIKNILKTSNLINRINSLPNSLQAKPLKENVNLNINTTQNILNNSIPIQRQFPNSLKNNSLNQERENNKFSNTMPSQTNNNILNQPQINPAINNKNNIIKNVKDLDIECLAAIKYEMYPQVQLSPNPFCKIVAYGANSYYGISKKNNEDKLKMILDYKLTKSTNCLNGSKKHPNISYFAIYDGHGGNKCSSFLQEKLDSLLFNSDYFPLYTLQAIYDGFTKAEKEFESIAFDAQKKILLDKSGSCALSLIIMEDWCFVSYLGDSRGLYSFDSGNQFFQITRDHKPNDPTEKARIEKAGGKVYKDTRLKVNGHKIHVNEQAAPGVKFPYRVSPGNLSVSNI